MIVRDNRNILEFHIIKAFTITVHRLQNTKLKIMQLAIGT